MPKSVRGWASSAALLAGVGLAAFAGGRSWAAGVPSESLRYSGVLELPDGTPVTGTHAIYVVFWPAASDGEQLCASAASDVEVTGGHFSVALPEACSEAVHSTPDVFVEVRVDAVSLGRARIGAVPFALEAAAANRASGELEARLAAAEGATATLEVRLAAVEARLGAASGFQARQTETQYIGPNGDTLIQFSTEVFDLGNEYDATTSVFTPTRAGLYLVRCTMRFENEEGGPGLTAFLSTSVRRNGEVVARDGLFSDRFTAYRSASSIVELSAGDQLDCVANVQVSTDPQQLYPDVAAIFEAFQLSGR
ncbi:MAG TPA: hypothetical protein VMG12_43360 [Polyangiaceae bacterium]|nr:hypothetical protein [Polyangiaceae bacterium]